MRPPTRKFGPAERKSARLLAPPRRWSWWSSITRRVLTVNLLAFAMLAGGILYLDRFERGLIATELESLQTQGQIFAAALSEGAVIGPFDEDQALAPELARQMVRRLVEPTRIRARIFDGDGQLLVDSRMLRGPGGAVQMEELPPVSETLHLSRWVFRIYDTVISWLPQREARNLYRENPVETAADYDEVARALKGDEGSAVRQDPSGPGLVLTVAVPIQTYKEVLGAVMLSSGSGDIDRKVRSVRLQILQISRVGFHRHRAAVALSRRHHSPADPPFGGCRRLRAAGRGEEDGNPRLHPSAGRDRRPVRFASRHDGHVADAHGRDRALRGGCQPRDQEPVELG